MKNDEYEHKPVLKREVLKSLGAHLNKQDSLEEKKIIDATLGLGGHSVEFLKLGAKVLGIDLDENNIEIARIRMLKACPPHLDNKVGLFKIVKDNFNNIDKIARSEGFEDVDGILYDLGLNMIQQTSKTRGFSFSNKGADLDMRLDVESQGVKASDLINSLNESQLFDLFEPFVGYGDAKGLSKKIVEKRSGEPFKSVGDFLKLFPAKGQGKKHPATTAFMALRIAVNSELVNLEESLEKAIDLVGVGGKILVISFHSSEDRIVKNIFNKFEKDGKGKVITKKPILPSGEELKKNISARSAKLRVLTKI